MVECLVANENVASSSLVSRSIDLEKPFLSPDRRGFFLRLFFPLAAGFSPCQDEQTGQRQARLLRGVTAFPRLMIGILTAYRRRNKSFRRRYAVDQAWKRRGSRLAAPSQEGLGENNLRIRFRNTVLYSALALVLCASASADVPAPSVLTPAAPPTAQALAARQAVAEGGGRWTLAWRTHDAALIAALFAADGAEMGRGGIVTRGRRAIGERFARLFGAIEPVQATRQTVDLWQMGSAVYESGRYSYVFAAGQRGQKPNVSAGNYVTVWQRQKNGQWLIHSDVTIAAR